jgi:hypothetical protein
VEISQRIERAGFLVLFFALALFRLAFLLQLAVANDFGDDFLGLPRNPADRSFDRAHGRDL